MTTLIRPPKPAPDENRCAAKARAGLSSRWCTLELAARHRLDRRWQRLNDTFRRWHDEDRYPSGPARY